jgi:hypothetical protein
VVSDTVTVTVRDTTPPVVNVPFVHTVFYPIGSHVRAVTFTITANDRVSGPFLAASCSPPSGSTFDLTFDTWVTCTATDAAGNQGFGVFVVEGEPFPGGPPALSLPGTIAGPATSASGAVVSYTATATLGGISFPASCGPASGSTFPIGTTTVNCSASNPIFGDTASGSFTVTVTLGAPSLRAVITGQGTDANGFFVVVRLTNIGTGHARNVSVTSLAFRTLNGTGTVSYNAAGSGPLPVPVGSVDVGLPQQFRLYLNVPSGVRRFSIVENGTVENVVGASSTFSFAQTVIP